MNKSIRLLKEIAAKKNKNIIGLMSGTSLDGLDIAYCDISGIGFDTVVRLKKFTTRKYPEKLVNKLLGNVSVDRVSLEEITLLHSWMGEYHADLVLESLQSWGIDHSEIDIIASHGQTFYHAPAAIHQKAGMPNATLQLVDGDHIARKTGILTLSDFRQKHTAAGGEGAPMIPLVDKLLFTDKTENRILLNIGGIANLTYLPRRESDQNMNWGDTGPGNILINRTMAEYFDSAFDENGKIASEGSVNAHLLKTLKTDPYFTRPMPKSTGPEYFNWEFVLQSLRDSDQVNIKPENLVATLTWMTSETIADAIKKAAGKKGTAIYISGGGVHNVTMMKNLKELLKEKIYIFKNFDVLGIDPDAREAVSFAVLANETLSGDAFTVDQGGGAIRNVNFGKISLPV